MHSQVDWHLSFILSLGGYRVYLMLTMEHMQREQLTPHSLLYAKLILLIFSSISPFFSFHYVTIFNEPKRGPVNGPPYGRPTKAQAIMVMANNLLGELILI